MKDLERYDVRVFLARKRNGTHVDAEEAHEQIEGWHRAYQVLRDEVRRLKEENRHLEGALENLADTLTNDQG
jgi:predicted RNase H-like nuclease (RuvC/YqgF family)